MHFLFPKDISGKTGGHQRLGHRETVPVGTTPVPMPARWKKIAIIGSRTTKADFGPMAYW
jgi:hypothetical protein